MTEELLEVVITLEHDEDDADQNSDSWNWIVEIALDAVDRSVSSGASVATEDKLREFLERNGVPVDLRERIWKVGMQYVKTSDSNEYFSKYGSLLNQSGDAHFSPHEMLKILQRFYEFLNELSRPAESISEPLVKQLTPKDVEILEYMAGFLLRSLFYHPTTPDSQKTVIKKLQSDIREGSIAAQRNRRSEKKKDRLWGTTQQCVDLMRLLETYFRQHAAVEPNLKLDDTTKEMFLNKREVLGLQGSLIADFELDQNHVKEIFRKIYSKFMKVRAHSYSKKLRKDLEKTSKPIQNGKGLRKRLKQYKPKTGKQ